MVPTIITLPNTFAATATYCQNQQEQLAVGPLITIHHSTYAVATMSIQNRLVLTAVPVGACIIVRTLMEFQSLQVLQSVAKEKFIKNLLDHHVAELKITTQALTFVVTEIFIPNQVATLAVDLIPTILDPMFVAMETLSVNQVGAPLVAEAIITTQVLNVAAVANYTVYHLVIIAVVPQCIGLLHKFAATTIS